MTTTTLLLDCIKDRSPSCDWRVLANYIKIIALISLNKDRVIKEALSVNLSGILTSQWRKSMVRIKDVIC